MLQKIAAIAGGVTLVILGASMAIKNPGKGAYEKYAVGQLTKYLKEEVCSQPSKVEDLPKFFQRQCPTIIESLRPPIQTVISQTTQRRNFVFFSVYRTDLDVGSPLPAYQFGTVGVFEKFYVYQADEL
ncbi:MAG: DUF4359 domain-containing protein [Symploca sp. SIO3C6]|uniref:DUF4359 domain-containing protein n=1 Tax=Symploca sp. SIO1C4 TaxID=2607765 RepID=A0A6B3NSI6_9CYAN|nr:DUF4359 domain-containing protein [Symploca sp. SIO3C6]NER32168.1 DUF4359 domain-containing protein [Symploca sp. SIO1C4]NET08213.1 DUF4359 domain-containing protein [Symploca sp. SIO2B6]NET54423.1 DUF4359 domain-containing protein [Merismopedia sp. SIO2A8]